MFTVAERRTMQERTCVGSEPRTRMDLLKLKENDQMAAAMMRTKRKMTMQRGGASELQPDY